MIKKISYFLLGAFLMVAGVVSAAPSLTYLRTILPETTGAFDLGTTTRAWRDLYVGQICLSGDCKTAWPTGGGGSGGGSWSTTTSTHAGRLVNYSNNNTDIVVIGSTSTTTAEYYFDPNTLFASLLGKTYFQYASTTALTASGNIQVPLITANTSAGIIIESNNGTDVGILGAGNTANSTFYGGVNIDGATRLATSLTGLLKATAGSVSTASNGTDYTLISATTCSGNDKVSAISASGAVTCSADQTGTGSAFPFTSNSWGNSTTTTLGFLNGFLSTASSTISSALRLSSLSNGGLGVTTGGLVYSSATTTAGTGLTFSSNAFNVNTSQNIATLSNLTGNGAILTSGGVGTLGTYAGTSCTNQFIRSLSGSIVATCATVANTDLANSTISGVSLGGTLANLTATDSTLTFSGTYTGATDRTIGLNLGNANTWTALQTFGNSSTTLGSFGYASSTVYAGGGLTSCSNGTTEKLLYNSTTGKFSCGTDQTGGGGSSLGQSWEIGGNGFTGFLAPTTTQKVWMGQASSTLLSAHTLDVGSIYGTTTIGVDGSVGIHSSPLANTHLYISTFNNPGDTALRIDGLDNEGVETAISVTDENGGDYFSVKSDGQSGNKGITIVNGLLGIGTTTPTRTITSESSISPQLSLSAGAGLAQWTFRNAGGNLYLATTTVAGTATSTTAALTIDTNGKVRANCFTIDGSTCLSGTGGSGTVTSVGISSPLSTMTYGSTPITTSGTFTGDLNLSNPNVWTGRQNFTNASSTLFSAGRAWFGTTATSSFDGAGNLTLATSSTLSRWIKVSPSGLVFSATTTQAISIFKSTNPDTTGNSWFEPYTITASTDNFQHLVGIASSTTAKTGFYGVAQIPADYVGGCSIEVQWTAPVTTGNAVFDFAYRSVGGNDTESLDDTIQETVTVTDAAPTAINRRLTAILNPTCSNFDPNDTMEFYVTRDGADASDTLGSDVVIHDVLFKYSD